MKKIWIGSFLLLVCLALFAQKKPSPERFRLVHSDKLYMNNLDTGQVLELNGKVHFFYGDTEFKSDRAIILDGPKIARLSGNVSVANDSLNLVADSLAYYRTTQVLNLGGRVRLDQKTATGKSRWFQGDYGSYDLGKDTFTTWSRVQAFDAEENFKSSCGYAFWDRKNGYAYLIESPKVSAGEADSLMITADKMEYFEAEKKLIATFNVVAKNKDYTAKSDFLIYFSNEEKAVFVGEPRFNNAFAEAEAQEFHLWFSERKLHKVALLDSCYVKFSQDENAEKQNWVRAENVEMTLVGDQLEGFSAQKNVSYYFLQEEKEKRDFFVNAATGQSLKAKFGKDNKLIMMNMQENIKGTYVFKKEP